MVTVSFVVIVAGTLALLAGPSPLTVLVLVVLAGGPVYAVAALRTRITFSRDAVVVRDLRRERSFDRATAEIGTQRVAGRRLGTGPLLVLARDGHDVPMAVSLSWFSAADRQAILVEAGLAEAS